jgi:hypothetical protein
LSASSGMQICIVIMPDDSIASTPFSLTINHLPSDCWCADNVYLSIFSLFGECVLSLLWLLFDFKIHKWNPCFIIIFVVSFWKSQSKSHSLRFVPIHEYFWNPLHAELVIAEH